MELIYEIDSNRSCDDNNKRALTTLDVPRQVSMIRELTEQRRKLAQKASRSSHVFIPTLNRISTHSEIEEIAKYFKMAPLIPDEVIKNADNNEVRAFGAAVIFADISGFTELSDKYQQVDNGASKLSTVLNFYLGIMVQEILMHSGDVLKYAGDALLAIFKVDISSSYQTAVQNAIDTSIVIQKSCQNFKTEIGIILNVKIAISCGEIHFSIIGDENLSYYVAVGEPIFQVKYLQDHIKPGEILLTQNAWFFTADNLYSYQFFRDYRCYKIKGFRDQTNAIRQQYEAINIQEKAATVMTETSDVNVTIQSESNLNYNNLSFEPQTYNALRATEERFAVRQTINVAAMTNSKKSLRRFIIAPLLNAIDLGESIDSLTEMRNVVIVFANFVVPERNAVQICKITDRIFTHLNNIVTSFQGTLNKVSLFDKDMMFLSIFGLRGQKHENECEVGLRCAHEILETFKSWPQISVVSIGVTSGTSYCGIVGHTLRREYSVISVTVNRAARLMMAYPGIVSCDEDTLIQSKMNFLRHFKKLPWQRLKGLQEDVRAFEFTDSIDCEEESVIDEFEKKAPMSGRVEVREKVQQCVIAAIEAFNSNDYECTGAWCFMIKGDGQQGKTRVINELYHVCVHQNLKCLRLILNAKHTSMRFWTLKYCLAKILEHENENKNIQDIIADKFSDLSVDGGYMSALNSIFDTNFPAHSTAFADGEAEIRKLVFRILCHHLSSHFWLVFIDDADYIDPDSLELLPTIFEARNIFFIFTIGKYCRKWTLAQKEIYVNEFVTQFRLQPIDKTFHKDIACQSINVSAIPIEVERFLHENSNGNPGWIENCASALLYAGKLRRRSMMIKEAITNGMILMNDLIKHNFMIENCNIEQDEDEDIFYDVSNIPLKTIVENTSSDINDDEKIIYVAELTSELTSKDFAGKHTTRKLMLYDSLSSHDQLVCKCAALLGNEFSRDMLNYLLSGCKERKIAKTIVQLFQSAIFKCASSRGAMREERVRKFSDTINCYCKVIKIPESCRDLPKYGNCAFIKFQDEAFRKYIYETLTEKQRLEYHESCISYLFFHTKKCINCKNERFEIIHDFMLNGKDGIVGAKTRCDNRKQMNESLLKILKLFVDDIKSTTQSHKPTIVLNFINHNFNQCSCTSILYSAFSKITQHCHGDEMKMKLLYSQVILADICIKLTNIPRALMLLDECFIQLNEIKDKTNMYDNNSHFITFLRGRVLMLRGICSKKMLQYDDALRYYLAAGDIFQISLPRKFNFIARCKLTHVRHVIKNSARQCHRKLSRVDSLITEQCSLLIQLLYELYMTMNDLKMAKLAAFWSLKKALKSGTKVGRIAKCFANVMHICIITNDIGESFDVQALNEVLRSISGDDIDAELLDSVVKMYAKIMQWNFLKNKVALAISMGEIARKLCYNLPTYLNLLEIIPIQLLLLIKSLQINDASKLLSEFGGIVKFHSNRSGIIWFYALAMDLLLDTCHVIVSYNECYKFHLELVTSSHHDAMNEEAIARFFANFWLWSIRNDMVERSERLMERLRAKFKLNSHSSINDVMTGIRVVEALTHHYVRAVEGKNIPAYAFFHYLITHYLNILKNDVKSTFQCFLERLLLHELHFEMINQTHSKLLQLRMGMLSRRAEMKKDYFTFNYLRHLRLNFGKRRENVKNHWKELNMKISSNLQQKIVFFTLPTVISEKNTREL